MIVNVNIDERKLQPAQREQLYRIACISRSVFGSHSMAIAVAAAAERETLKHTKIHIHTPHIHTHTHIEGYV